jgi:hypothetical protein
MTVLEQVVAFDHQVTGITVSADGRTFVNFPRWTDDAPVSVADRSRDPFGRTGTF